MLKYKHLLFHVLLGGCLFLSCPSRGQSKEQDQGNSWAEVQKSGKGKIKVYWYESRPFIFKGRGKMEGIEAEIIEGFQKYLLQNRHVNVEIVWREANDFGDTYNSIRDKKETGAFGTSAFSITPQRLREVGFGPSYMSDITVLISSKGIPVVKNLEEFDNVFSNLTAVTIKETTYEEDLLQLREAEDISFKIEYIPSQQNILHTIEKMDSAFGFIDLPVYMMIFSNDPSITVSRQNLFPIKRKGYSIIFPLGSDWAEPLNAYFEDPYFKTRLETIISSYIDRDLYRFVESLATQPNEPVILLNKEKEIQQRNLAGKIQQIIQETRRRNFLIALVAVVLVSLVTIAFLYRKRSEQKLKIEAQGKSLAQKSEELEKRNQHLLTLDQEKNSLIKILAHDLRTPINHVQGLAHILLLDKEGLSEDQKMVVANISEASVRLNKMITNILDIDAIENDRVKIFVEDVIVCSLVERVVKSFEKQAQKKNITLSFASGPEKMMIKGDSLFLTQIFENLLSNAIKFSEPGKKIDVVIMLKKQVVRIEVRDQGPGLTEDDLKMLFNKFERLSAKPTAGESSLGLGLSIVKKYVELMDGQVHAESKPGLGAVFIVEFTQLPDTSLA